MLIVAVVYNFKTNVISVSESQRTLAVEIERSGNTDGTSSVGMYDIPEALNFFFGECVPHGFPKVGSGERIFLEK